MTTRPGTAEYAPYHEQYVSLVPDGDIRTILSTQLPDTLALLWTVPASKAVSTYAPGKWSIKEVIGHLVDTERIMAYRALCIARADQTPLPGFEQDDYVAQANFNARALPDLITEWERVRWSTVTLFTPWSDTEWLRQGTANNCAVSARALAYIIAGHELHHRDHLRTRYLA